MTWENASTLYRHPVPESVQQRPERVLRSFVGLGGLSPAPNHHGAAAGTGTGRDQMVPGRSRTDWARS